VELQKCEYQFTATSPALCLPLDDAAAATSATLEKGKPAGEL
jgi:hypothetical protein